MCVIPLLIKIVIITKFNFYLNKIIFCNTWECGVNDCIFISIIKFPMVKYVFWTKVRNIEFQPYKFQMCTTM